MAEEKKEIQDRTVRGWRGREEKHIRNRTETKREKNIEEKNIYRKKYRRNSDEEEMCSLFLTVKQSNIQSNIAWTFLLYIKHGQKINKINKNE